ncbi:hypothetical protein FNYG_06057 [Fusarium nygamai]|uniref:Uncharacterized protein n=1 Tax=Gibberella nygamai TaxID=42673 RepID=A0A2K0WDW2_GIBNY|nr:hypothetical protein FNYG_06057 [Fusarium nygamai]
MSDYSPTSSSYQTPATSPSGILYNAENGIRFIAHGMRNTTTGEIVILDPRNVQQWELDVALAITERTTNQLEASLYTATRELDRQITQIHDDMNAILRLRKEDLKRAQRRRNQTMFVFGVLAGILLFLVLKHRGKELFVLLHIE